MEDDPTEEQIKAEIAAAVKILREDGVHLHKTYRKKYLAEPPEGGTPPEPPQSPKEGDPPPLKGKGKENEPVKRKGIWWGNNEPDD